MTAVPDIVTRARASDWTFVTYPAPVVPAPRLLAAYRTAPLVAWSSDELTIVGIGCAYELRGTGAARWRELISAARAIGDHARMFDTGGIGDLARPRFLGGLAFAPGAANRAPWTGFGDAWFMLPRWTYVHDGKRGALIFARRGHDPVPGQELADLRVALATAFASRPQPPLTAIDPGDRDAWRSQVRATTDAIARGEYAKIVAARSAVVSLAGEPRRADMFAELDARHGETVRLLVRPPGGGTLIAATPERLVRLTGSTVACDALAGSRARGDVAAESEQALFASTKDRREHALVVDAIARALRDLGGDLRMPDAPAIRTLRHVLHLHTPITAELGAPRHLLEVAEALHPTPAVGGTPTRVALDWIAARESPRGWYASPVGWFDLDGNGELAVALRSGVLTGERAHLWAGAGIVAGSDPDRELAETDIKLRAMLGALGVSA
jgi:menaquinone-specific isochorismate synthase